MKPQAFATFTYLCYHHTHGKESVSPSVDEIASKLHMSKDMAAEQLTELKQRGLLNQHLVPACRNTGKNFFSLPNELFFLNLGHGAITVYAYLLYCEDRRTHQCHPSYRTIASAVHLTVATVMKHIAKLEDRQLIAVEHTSYLHQAAQEDNPWAQYLLGKLYLMGDGVEQDENTAYQWFQAAAEQGHVYAEFFVERMEQGWTASPQLMLSTTRLLHHMGNIFRDNAPAAPASGGPHIDRKRLQKLRAKKIALGHKPDDHEEEQSWGMSMG